jgi:hypothetical protein
VGLHKIGNLRTRGKEGIRRRGAGRRGGGVAL